MSILGDWYGLGTDDGSDVDSGNPLSRRTKPTGGGLLVSRYKEKTPVLTVEKKPEDEETGIVGGIIQGIKTDIAETIKNPLYALPAALEAAGTVAGGVGTFGVGGIAGGVAGRIVGETLQSLLQGTPLFTKENAFELAMVPATSLAGSLVFGAGKRLLGYGGKGAGKELIKPLYQEGANITVDGADDTIQKAYLDALMKRKTKYHDMPMERIKAGVNAYLGRSGPTLPANHVRLYRLPESVVGTLDKSALPDTVFRESTRGGKKVSGGKFWTTDQSLAWSTLPKDSKGDAVGKFMGVDLDMADFNQFKSVKSLDNMAKKPFRHTMPSFDDTEKAFLKEYETVKSFQAEEELVKRIKLDTTYNMFEHKLDQARRLGMAKDEKLIELERAGKAAGAFSQLMDSQVVLRKMGLVNIADLGLQKEAFEEAFNDDISTRLVSIGKKYGIGERLNADEQTAAWFLHGVGSDVAESLRKLPDTAARVTFLKSSAKATGGMKPETVVRIFEATDEYKREVGDRLFALAHHLNPDPDALGRFNENFVNTTSLAHQSVSFLEQDLGRVTAQLEQLAADGVSGGQMYDLLTSQRDAIKRSLVMAKPSTVAAQRATAMVRAHWDKFGVIPTRKEGAFLDKEWDLAFGSNFLATLYDYSHGAMKTITSKAYIPAMTGLLKQVENPGNYDFAAKYINMLSGNIRMGTVSKWSNALANTRFLPEKTRKWASDPRNLNRALGNINKLAFVKDIGINAKFIPMNMTQHVLTTRVVIGDEYTTYGMASAAKSVADMMSGGSKTASDAFNRAVAAGALRKESLMVIGEAGLEANTPSAFTAIPRYSEMFNRLSAFLGAERQALEKGLSAEAAAKYGKDMVDLTQFDYSAASRMLASATPLGSLALRYKSFGIKYAHMLGHLAKEGRYDAIAESLLGVWAIGGTAGFPLMSAVRAGLAQAGIYMPEVDPLHEVTGISMGSSGSPFPGVPTTLEELAGPVLGPISGIASTVAGGEFEQAGVDTARFLLGSTNKVLEAGLEAYRGGVTRDSKGVKVAERTPEQIAKSALGIGPSLSSQTWRTKRNISLAYSAGDRQAMKAQLEEARTSGLRNLRRLKSQAVGSARSAENESPLANWLKLQ